MLKSVLPQLLLVFQMVGWDLIVVQNQILPLLLLWDVQRLLFGMVQLVFLNLKNSQMEQKH